MEWLLLPAATDNSLRDLKQNKTKKARKKKEGIINWFFAKKGCAQGHKLNEKQWEKKSANVSKQNKQKNAKFLHRLAYLMNN